MIDEGNVDIKNMEQLKVGDPRARYLGEIARASGVLNRKVEKIMARGDFPLVLGGDHSIAGGTVSGIAAFARPAGKRSGSSGWTPTATSTPPRARPPATFTGCRWPPSWVRPSPS